MSTIDQAYRSGKVRQPKTDVLTTEPRRQRTSALLVVIPLIFFWDFSAGRDFAIKMTTTETATWNNTVGAGDVTAEPEAEMAAVVYLQFAAILLLVTVTVSGNLLLLAVVFRSRQLRSSVSNALIVNLAVADCLVGLFVLPAFATTVLQGGPPNFGASGQGLCSASAYPPPSPGGGRRTSSVIQELDMGLFLVTQSNPIQSILIWY